MSDEQRAFNFAAGPSAMPEEVLKKAQNDLLCYPGAGSSVMEMSHRSAVFQKIIDDAEACLRRIMDIPEEYAVLFLQGGASMQFSMVPMNLSHQGDTTAYVTTGNFAAKALAEAKRWGNAVEVASGKEGGFTSIPKITEGMIPTDAKYLHITGNNTIFGTTWWELPGHGNIPLVADWSSAILGKQINVRDYALIYAGAQKNIGPAGLTLAIVRKDIIPDDVDDIVPTMLRYKPMIDNGSMYNTPPCFAIYMAGLMFDWVEEQGGVAEMERRNMQKAEILFEFLHKICKRIYGVQTDTVIYRCSQSTDKLVPLYIDDIVFGCLCNEFIRKFF